MNNHTRYLSDKVMVCNEPERLGADFIIIDADPDLFPCRECQLLVITHNRREYEAELNETVLRGNGADPEPAFHWKNIFSAWLMSIALIGAFFFLVWVFFG